MSKLIELTKDEEELLKLLINKYNETNNMVVSLEAWEIPKDIQTNARFILEKLMEKDCISRYNCFVDGGLVATLLKNGIDYYNSFIKGLNDKQNLQNDDNLIEEEEKLLKDIIDLSKEKNVNIAGFLNKKIEKDNDYEDLVHDLKEGGFINLLYADNEIYFAVPTSKGKLYFSKKSQKEGERNKNKSNSNIITNNNNFNFSGDNNTYNNIGNIINTSNFTETEEFEKLNNEDKKEILEIKDEINKLKIEMEKNNKNINESELMKASNIVKRIMSFGLKNAPNLFFIAEAFLKLLK